MAQVSRSSFLVVLLRAEPAAATHLFPYDLVCLFIAIYNL
jgi:hypothetical protein